jgi:hypothetical protein
MSCSMLYMYFAAAPRAVGGSAMAAGAAPGTADFVALPLFFVAMLAISAVWHVDALSRFSRPAFAMAGGISVAPEDPVAAPWLAPRLEMGCHIAMCVAMAFMLVLML